MTGRMHMVPTRSGIGPAVIPERDRSRDLPIAWYAPKPPWMTHIPSPWLRFGDKFAFRAYLARVAGK